MQLLQSRAKLLLAVFCVCALAGFGALAQSSPQITKGIQWLTAQINAVGELISESASVAGKAQVKYETLATLKLLAAVPPALSDSYSKDAEDVTEMLARKLLAANLGGAGNTALADQLVARQNPDGGFSPAPSFASSIIDTAWAVLALAQQAPANYGGLGAARNYLAAQILSDGGINGGANTDRIAKAALASLALQTGGDANAQNASRTLSQWLLQRQSVDGSWSNDVLLTAYSLIAVGPQLSDPNVLGTGQAYLASKQLPDGSWQGDPFLTAVALRALALTNKPNVVVPTKAQATGVIVDGINNQPIANAVVTLVGSTLPAVNTDATGKFTLGDIPAGPYVLNVNRSGYQTLNSALSLSAGQSLDLGRISLSIVPNTGVIAGLVLDADTKQPLSNVAIALSGSASKATQTNATGRFEIAGVPPGAITLTATLAGYQVASGAANISAGQTLLFSPLLFKTGNVVPTDGKVFGVVANAATGAPLSGVQVVLNGAVKGVTAADGGFNYTIPVGSYTIEYRLTGYDTAQQQFTLPAGTQVDAGKIQLSPTRTTTTISGKVLNTLGQPIPGALVQLVGMNGVNADATGAYRLEGLAGNSFNLRASANGYVSQNYTLNVSKPTDITQNFILQVVPPNTATAALSITSIALSGGNFLARKDILINATVVNGSPTSANGLVRLLVIDPNNKVVAQAGAQTLAGASVGQVTLNAGAQLPVQFKWNTAQFSPGNYQVSAQIVEPGSISRANPLGSVISEVTAGFAISPELHFTGAITSNPPVLRAGLNTSVKLSAVIQNDGNQTLLAQSYDLKIIDTKTGATVATQTVNADAIAVSAIKTVALQDWLPAAGGDYRLELTSASASQGKLLGKVYVGDAANAVYTLDKTTLPVGSSSVKAKVSVTGQDAVTGVISDPLAPLVKEAIKKSVPFNDQIAYQWSVNNRCQGCHVQTQALVGGELNRRLSDYNPLQRSTIFNNTSLSQYADGVTNLGWGGGPQTLTTFSLWALTAYHKPQDIALSIKRAADYLADIATPQNAYWGGDWNGGWWSSGAPPHIAMNLQSLSRSHAILSATPTRTVENWLHEAVKSYEQISLSMPMLGNYLRPLLDSDGAWVIGQGSGFVHKIDKDGVKVKEWNIGYFPLALIREQGSNNYLASTENGLYRLLPDGTATRVLDDSARPLRLVGLVYGFNGDLYGLSYSEQAIYKLAASTFQPSQLAILPEASSFIAYDDANKKLVVTGNAVIYNIASDASIQTVTATHQYLGSPTSLTKFNNRWLVSYSSGALVGFDPDWYGQNIFWDYGSTYDVQGNDTGLYGWRRADGKLYRFNNQPVSVNASLDKYEKAIKQVSQLLVGGLISNDGLDSPIPTAQHLIALGEARKFLLSRDPALAAQLLTKMREAETSLRAAVHTDGGWRISQGFGYSDALVTAQVGYALDYLNPSPSDPVIRNAVQFLLGKQEADGSWGTAIMSTREAATTWVSIWLPTILDRIGGIDTDLSLSFAANTLPTNFDVVPSTVTPNPDGSTAYLWKLTGVTNAGQSLNFDLAINDLGVNETRPASILAALKFNNSFTNEPVESAIEIPKVTGSAFMQLTGNLNKQSFTANEAVLIQANVLNQGTGNSAGTIRYEIFAPDGSKLSELTNSPFSGLAPAATVTLPASWNTGLTRSASMYVAKISLLDQSNKTVMVVDLPFNITATATGPQLSGTIQTDKLTYQPQDSVRVIDRVNNLSLNTPFSGGVATTTVTSATGAVIFTKSEGLTQVNPSSLTELAYLFPLNNAPAGKYTTLLRVLDNSNQVVATATGSFTVASTADTGVGLLGTLTAPSTIPVGDTLKLDALLKNSGNADLGTLPYRIKILNPATSAVIATLADINTALPLGTQKPASWNWLAQGTAGTTLAAGLFVQFAGQERILAQATFTLTSARDTVAGTLVGTPKPLAVGEVMSLGLTASNVGSNALTGVIFTTTVINTSAGNAEVFKAVDTSNLALAGTFNKTYTSTPVGIKAGDILKATTTATIGSKVITLGSDTINVIAARNSLTGTLALTNKAIDLGQSAIINLSVQNTGSNALPGTLITLKVLDNKGQSVYSIDETTDLALAATYQKARNYQPALAGSYTVQLLAKLTTSGAPATAQLLAQDSFTVKAPSTSLTTKLRDSLRGRVLVWATCKRAADELDGQCGATAFPNEDATKLTQCDMARRTFIDQYLTTKGIPHKVVATEAAFLSELRQGNYDTLWLSGGSVKLSDTTLAEITANLRTGAGLIVDGLHDGRNPKLDDLLGIQYRGKWPANSTQKLTLISDFFGSANQNALLSVKEQPLKLLPAPQAKAQANYSGTAGQAPYAAIISYQSGAGRTLTFGFDWANTLKAATAAGANPTDANRWQATVSEGLQQTRRNQRLSRYPALDIVPLTVDLSNTGSSTATVEVRLPLPTGVILVSSQPSVTSNTLNGVTTLTWQQSINSGQSLNLDTDLRLAANVPSGGQLTLAATLNLIDSAGVKTFYKTETLVLQVKSANQLLDGLLNQLKAVSSPAANDQRVIAAMQAQLTALATDLLANDLRSALRRSLMAQQQSERLTHADKAALQLSLAELIRALERRL